MEKCYTVRFGSPAAVRFKSAYTGGIGSVRYHGVAEICSEDEVFGYYDDLDSDSHDTAVSTVTASFEQAFSEIFNEHYRNDATANPKDYQADYDEIIAVTNQKAVGFSHSFRVSKINEISFEIDAEKVATNDSNTESNTETTQEVAQASSETPSHKSNNTFLILAIVLGVLLVVAAIVTIVLVNKGKNKTDSIATSAPNVSMQNTEANPEEQKENNQ